MTDVLVTGGAGYIGTPLCEELLASGRSVRILDVMLHGQEDIAARLDDKGVEIHRADIRDAAGRAAALDGVKAVVHLAAIVGDPACALDTDLSNEVNVEGTRSLIADARSAGVERLVFASTCSNYGRMTDPTHPITEDGELAPVSLYAEQKVSMERLLLEGDTGDLVPTCLRFATVYGVAPRMRFDLTVNEFTRDLWAGRELEVFGEQFWRPYVHVRDAGRAVRTVLDAPLEQVGGEVFNAGRSGENYRKLDLVEQIQRHVDSGTVTYVSRAEDPRDYKVSFDKIRAVLGYETLMTVPDGIAELVQALSDGQFLDPYDGRYRNIPELVPLFDLRLTQEDLDAVEQTLRSGWLTMGPRTLEFEQAFAAQLGVRHVVALSSCTTALHLAYLGAGVGPGDEVIVPSYTFAATASAAIYCGARPIFADIIGASDLSLDPEHLESLIGPRTKAVCVVHFGGYAAPVARLAEICARHGIALIEDCAHAPSATPAAGGRKLGGHGLASAFSLFSNKILSVGEGGMLATDDDDVAAMARSLRSHGMTAGTWERHSGRSDSYDVTALGFNYRIDDVRSTLALSRLRYLEQDIAERRRLTHAYRAGLADLPGISVPYSDAEVDHASCYAMPVLLDDPERQGPLRIALREKHGIQTTLLYPPVHAFSAYVERYGTQSLPRTEDVSRREVTLPLYPHLSRSAQQRVLAALRAELAAP